MSERRIFFRPARWLALSLAMTLLGGCQFGIGGSPTAPAASPGVVVSTGISTVTGTVRAPSWMLGDDGRAAQVVANNSSGVVANNSSGVVANNSSGVVANNSSGVVANHSSGYRTQDATGSATLMALANALVFFTAPDETLLHGADGQVLHTLTDANGQFTMPALPANQTIVVTVLMPGNRRLVGYLNTRAGTNSLDIDLATTYVTEFLRDHARTATPVRTLGSYDSTLVTQAVTSTRAVLAQNPVLPDLRVDHVAALRNQYAMLVGTISQDFSDRWKALLGYRPLAITAIDGIVPTGYSVYGMAVAPTTSTIYLAGFGDGGGFIRSYDAAGATAVPVHTDNADPYGLAYPFGMFMAPDGHLLVAEAQNHYVAKVLPGSGEVPTPTSWPFVDPVFTTFGLSPSDLAVGAADVCQDELGNVYVADWDNQVIERIPATSAATASMAVFAGGQPGIVDFAGDGDQATSASFNTPANVTYHAGALYVSDTLNQRIRRIDLGTGVIQTVWGNAPKRALVDGINSLQGGFDGDGRAPLETSLSSPHKVVFDASGSMIVADTDNARVRIVDNGLVKTLVGSTGAQQVSDGSGGEAASFVIGHPWYLAMEPDGNLLISDDLANGRIWRLWLKFGR